MRRIAAVLLVSATTLAAQQQTSAVIYPQTRKVDTVTNYFGTVVSDPYRWMEDIETPDVARDGNFNGTDLSAQH